jgi:hypothetical protein
MSLVQIVVVSSALASLGPRSRRWPAALPLLSLLAAVACVFIDCRFNRTVLTLVGIPSIITAVLVVDFAITRNFGKSLLSADSRRALVRYLAVCSLILYPSALGVIRFDVYRLGFNAAAPAAIALVGVLLAARRRFRLAIVVLVVLLALDVRLLPTVNALDYVIDPIGGLLGIGWSAVRVTKFVAARLRARQPAVPRGSWLLGIKCLPGAMS